ncbi:hypothetical protein [Mycolicibacterium gilvum]|uniref:Uncharacterized protein n=1 Tax=Mycolicibacterium gilvum TaxID=1804 RepID=A0A378SHS3_9MYCO|nr:hypothetical protein [Mycolicibacterium gilvum]MCV7056285.1 hypothetical protein [Mycolicibacterium gilvum]STZ41708.1 Uncharacterised protein [Mycolicibacterium gilvum]
MNDANLDDPNEAIRTNLESAREHVKAGGARLIADTFPLVNVDSRRAIAEITANLISLEEAIDGVIGSEAGG